VCLIIQEAAEFQYAGGLQQILLMILYGGL